MAIIKDDDYDYTDDDSINIKNVTTIEVDDDNEELQGRIQFSNYSTIRFYKPKHFKTFEKEYSWKEIFELVMNDNKRRRKADT